MGSLHLCLASFSCCTRTPNSHPQPKLSKVDFLNLSQSLVIMLAMLNFFILFVQRYIIIICSHPRPLQHTSPQYVGLDVHLTNMPQLQTRSSTLTKKLCSCAAPFVFSAKLAFVPYPWASDLFARLLGFMAGHQASATSPEVLERSFAGEACRGGCTVWCVCPSFLKVPDVQVEDYLQTQPLYSSDLGITLKEVTTALLQPSFLERVIQADSGGFDITASPWGPAQQPRLVFLKSFAVLFLSFAFAQLLIQQHFAPIPSSVTALR